jgi:hypothetical protein
MSTMRRLLDRDAELEPELAEDRRRPGRADGVSPELIPLLRGTPVADAKSPYPDDDDPDQLASARGVVIWVLISAAALSALVIFLISR